MQQVAENSACVSLLRATVNRKGRAAALGGPTKIQLSPEMAQDLHAALQAELVEQQEGNAADRDLQTRRLTVLEAQRRKILEATTRAPSTWPCSARSRTGSAARPGRPRSC